MEPSFALSSEPARRSTVSAKGAGKRRLTHLREDGEGRAGGSGAGDDPRQGVCLGEDQQGPGERGTAVRM